MSIENPNFLPEKYKDLAGSKPVERAVQKKTRETGSGPRSKADRIQTYLNRLERLVMDPDKEQKREMFGDEARPRALRTLREMVMNKYVRPNKEKMAEGAARVEERAAREMGIEAHYGEAELAERGEIAVEDLEKSLDSWIKYLSDANEQYPTWFRYYAFRNVLDLGDYDKDKGEFTKRSAGSTRLFPDIDRGALAYVEQMIEAAKDPAMLERLQKAQRVAANQDVPADQLITKEKAVNFSMLSFAKQYAEGIRQAGEITPEMRQETKGAWVKYQKDTDPTALWASLQNKGTAWCTKGFATAEKQLEGGDFYVYYTADRQGKPSIPRIAIRMQGDSVGEVRGVADNDQNLEGNMAEIAEEKMKDLPGSERYKKASADMKQLTAIERKIKHGENLNRNELVFLYELESPIAYFGYEKDPRIAELRSTRNPREDAPIVLDCKPEEIAWSQKEIKPDIKAYIGPLFTGIFETGIEQIYTAFPEGRMEMERDFEAGPITPEEFEKLAKQHNRNISDESLKVQADDYGRYLMNRPEFKTLKSAEKFALVRLKVSALGKDFAQGGATTAEIIGTEDDKDEQGRPAPFTSGRMTELGLELCPPETGPHKRLKDLNQPMNARYRIAMKPITDRNGNPLVFNVARDAYGLWLNDNIANPAAGGILTMSSCFVSASWTQNLRIFGIFALCTWIL